MLILFLYLNNISCVFFLQDLDIVKMLLDREHRNLLIMAVDKEPVERGVGSVFSSA